ncbi:MAG: hypothetical protein IK005_03025 [Paludibacteraceae bacterium]|nr:hypothetical protein [Paludibacteraceae bacterium]
MGNKKMVINLKMMIGKTSQLLLKQAVLFSSLLFLSPQSYAETWLDCYDFDLWNKQLDLKVVLDDFLIKNDTESYYLIPYAQDTSRSFCFYESEYFMYSLMMALDFDNAFAYSELDRLLTDFYDNNNLGKGDFSNRLSSFFKGRGQIPFQVTIANCDIPDVVRATDLMDKQVLCEGLFTNKYLLEIIQKGNSLCYYSLSDTLKKYCDPLYNGKRDYWNDCNGSKMVFYTIYHIDKNNSSDGYYALFRLIYDFYDYKEKRISENAAQLLLYLLRESACMGNEEAKNYYRMFVP